MFCFVSRKLSVVVDVSCDCSNPNNPIPIYNDITTFKSPARQVHLRYVHISIEEGRRAASNLLLDREGLI